MNAYSRSEKGVASPRAMDPKPITANGHGGAPIRSILDWMIYLDRATKSLLHCLLISNTVPTKAKEAAMLDSLNMSSEVMFVWQASSVTKFCAVRPLNLPRWLLWAWIISK